MKKIKRTFGERLKINVLMSLLLILISLLPFIFLVIVGDIYLSDMFNFLENLETIYDYGMIISFVYSGLLILFAIICFSVRKVRTGWTIYLSIFSLLEAALIIYFTISY
jgi:amino acid transporter